MNNLEMSTFLFIIAYLLIGLIVAAAAKVYDEKHPPHTTFEECIAGRDEAGYYVFIVSMWPIYFVYVVLLLVFDFICWLIRW